MTKFLSVFLSFMLVFSIITVNAFASQSLVTENNKIIDEYQEIDKVVSEKKALRAKCIENNVAEKFAELDMEKRKIQKEEIYKKLFAGELSVEKATLQLESLGVFPLESSIKQSVDSEAQTVQLSSFQSITFNDIYVYYDSVLDVWELGGGVYWNDSSWLDDVPYALFPYEGMNLDVGGYDGVGISLTQTSGTYNCYLVDTWLYVNEGGGAFDTTTHVPMGGINARYGVFHQFQDYAHLAELNGFNGTYVYYGKHMSIFAQYSSNFENYHGTARLEYVHTWDETTISSVGISSSISDPLGFSVEFSSSNNYFHIASPSETYFHE